MRRFHRLVLAGAAVVALFAAAPAVESQWTVFDPTNHVENILQAARALEQIQNQVEQIQNQVQSLTNQATMLQNLGFDASGELNTAMQQVQQLMSSAQRVTFETGQVDRQFEEVYPETYEGADFATVAGQADQWVAENRATLQAAMRTQAHVAQGMSGTEGRISAALAASNSAPGQKAAVQATNQLVGILASQIQEMQGLMITQARAIDSKIAAENAAKARSKEMRDRMWEGLSDERRSPVPNPFIN